MSSNYGSGWYGGMLLLALGLGLLRWRAAVRQDSRLFVIYFAGLLGGFLGAKLVFLCAEGWHYYHYPDFLQRAISGKSIIGGIVGGYCGVELGKLLCKYSQPTGDRFAAIVPAGLVLGRIGCLLYGCCLGAPCPEHWYALIDARGQARFAVVPAEIIFNLGAWATIWLLSKRAWQRTQHFHLYMMAYGFFRFFEEFYRELPPMLGAFTGYQGFAIGLFLLGAWRYWGRWRSAHYPIQSTR